MRVVCDRETDEGVLYLLYVCSCVATPAPHVGGCMAQGIKSTVHDPVLEAVNIGIVNETQALHDFFKGTR